MKCIYCAHCESRVLDSRQSDDGTLIRRRRECLNCFKRFTTFEKAEPVRLMVIKKDGAKQPFDLSKLKKGIQKACEKRPVDENVISDLADRIQLNALSVYGDNIPASEIGKMVIDELKKVDEVALYRFSLVYHEVNDLEDIQQELSRLKNERPQGKAD